MNYIKYIMALSVLALLTACGTTSTTTTTKYDADGNITEVIESINDTSDLATYINAGDGNVTSLNGDITSFNLGYNGVGLKYLSVSGGRQKAPVNSDSNSAEALEKIADVVAATKTSIVTETVAVNGELATTTSTESNAEESAEAESVEAEPEESSEAEPEE